MVLAFTPLVGLCVSVVVQILSCRYGAKVTLFKSIFIGFGAGMAVVLCMGLYAFFMIPGFEEDFVYVLATDLIAYSAFGYCYFHFINLGETARRIRIMRELYDSDGGLSMEEILEKYNAKEMVRMRINRLVSKKQILDKAGRYYIGNSTMLLMSKAIVMMKLLVLGKKSEFD